MIPGSLSEMKLLWVVFTISCIALVSTRPSKDQGRELGAVRNSQQIRRQEHREVDESIAGLASGEAPEEAEKLLKRTKLVLSSARSNGRQTRHHVRKEVDESIAGLASGEAPEEAEKLLKRTKLVLSSARSNGRQTRHHVRKEVDENIAGLSSGEAPEEVEKISERIKLMLSSLRQERRGKDNNSMSNTNGRQTRQKDRKEVDENIAGLASGEAPEEVEKMSKRSRQVLTQ